MSIKNQTEKVLVLQSQNDSLTTLLLQQREKAMRFEQELTQAKQELSQKQQLGSSSPNRPAAVNTSALPPLIKPKSSGISLTTAVSIGLLLAFLGVFAGRTWFKGKTAADDTKTEETSSNTKPTSTTSTRKKRTPVTPTPAPIQPPDLDNPGPDAGQVFTVFADYAYFHNEPNEESRRKANLNRWNEARLTAEDDVNGYIYVEYTNDRGQVSKGWLDKKDLLKVTN